MNHRKMILTSISIFLLIFYLQSPFVNGRQLKEQANHLPTNHGQSNGAATSQIKGSDSTSRTQAVETNHGHSNGGVTSQIKGSDSTSKAQAVDTGRDYDYRPTTPGRSPGVGHSIEN